MAEFSVDWTSYRYGVWREVLAPFVDRRISILEVGSWEGRSAVFFLDYLPLSTITCVDNFAGEPSYATDMNAVERRFDSNLAPYAGRITKIRNNSAGALATLLAEQRQFDLIYLDGSHLPHDVLIDTALAWPMLNVGGILIWDDYDLVRGEEGPGGVIDAFLSLQRGNFTLLHRGGQCIIRRTTSAQPQISTKLKRVLLRLV